MEVFKQKIAQKRDYLMIEFLNLYKINERFRKEIDEKIKDILNSAWYLQGKYNEEFLRNFAQFCGTKYALGVANGLDALSLIIRAYDFGTEDEIIVPANTYIASILSISQNGCTPVLVEPNINTYNINVDLIEEKITEKTRAIMVVHLYGRICWNKKLENIARKYKLKIIEDNAQAIGADYLFADGTRKKTGALGHIGCTSFFPSKNLGCYGDGGAVFTDNEELAQRLRVIVNHGMEVRYYHDSVGVNSRLDSIQAAILRIKLRRLDDYAQARQKAARRYDTAFDGHPSLSIPVRSPYSTHVFHQYTLKTKGVNRFALQQYLMDQGVPAMVYYPVPMHMQKAYQDPRYAKGAFPVTEKLSEQVISLPMHTELDEEQLEYITTKVLSFFDQ